MLGEYLSLAFKTLNAYRMRSVLTVLSITIGVSAIILLTSIAQSGVASLSKGIEEIGGTRFILTFPEAPKKAARKAANYTKGLTQGDVQALSRLELLERLTASNTLNNVAIRRPGASEVHADVIEGDPEFLPFYSLKLQKGRGLNDEDLREHRRVAVVGGELAEKLAPGEDILGKQIVIKGDRYRVVGHLVHTKKLGFNPGFDFSNLAIIPLPQSNTQITTIAMTSRDAERNRELLDRANAILLHRHNQVDDFQFLDFAGILKGFYAVLFGMILVVGLISGMSLVIGGVGIMNIMLVAVSERRREIGLRKAVGATKATIRMQFLVESVVLSLFGASFGVVLGGGLAWIIAVVGTKINAGWVGVVSQPAILVAILASCAIGCFFGWYPAKQAAEQNPILCLRTE